MKQISLILLGVGILYFVFFTAFTTKATVETPEIKKSGTYDRPIKDGKCYIQKDSAGNEIRVCG